MAKETDEIKEKEISLLVDLVPLGLVDDNPYNSRQTYSPDEIKSMAESIKQNGLLEAPEGRRIANGRIQIVFGHKRLRAYRLIAETNSAEKWKRFPVYLHELTDTEMLDQAIEENLQRSNVRPVDVARALAKFSEAHPDVKDKDIAKKHGMSDSQISNMKRVLRLPQKFLDMIDTDTISFTQGRELLTLEELPNAEEMMTGALTAMVSNGFPDTVEGLKQAIQIVNPVQKKEKKQTANEKAGLAPVTADTPAVKMGKQEEIVPPGSSAEKRIAIQKAASEKLENISQEKSAEPVELAAAAVISGAAAGPEPRTETNPEAVKIGVAVSSRAILIEENEKGINISFTLRDKGMVIRGMAGFVIENILPTLRTIMDEMTAELNHKNAGGKKK